MGLLLGPSCNLVLSLVDLSTPLGHLTKLNSPGLLVSLLWAVFSLLMITLYSDLTLLAREERIHRELTR